MKTPYIAFAAADGSEVSFPQKMTLAELLKAGVTSIRIVQPNAPLLPGEYRDKGDRLAPRKKGGRGKNLC